ncbi:hypothetical protein F5I97DRAFT_1099436 [Phlebopus sp. FC_14]|nr:hypothetical protein F5I97DRAFT_1099436 [Phlebopus sp. FC_14]
MNTTMPAAVISNATRIWDIDVHWSLYSQCGIWDPKRRGVDIWECIRAHDSTPSTMPPNSTFWRYIGRR